MRRHGRAIATAFLLLAPASLRAADAPPGQADYLAGLDALENRQWPDAATAFSKATAADDENANYHLGLGIAKLATNDAKTSITELTRAYRLNSKDLTIKRWTAGAYRYAGDEDTAAKIDAASDWRGVQSACQEYSQALRYSQRPSDVADKKAAFENEIIAFARQTRGNTPGLQTALLDRIRANLIAHQYDDALHDLNQMLAKDPLNIDLLRARNVALIGKGEYVTARIELTYLLSVASNDAMAYAMRAIAEANLGCRARAASDWGAAQQYDAAMAQHWGDRVQAALSQSKDLSAASPQAAWNTLRDAALAGKTFDELVPLALDAARVQNAHRRRWDEEYQDEYRTLSDTVRAKPNDVDALMALGVFLYRQAEIPGEQLGPGGAYRAFRFGGAAERTRELTTALHLFGRVRKLQQNNAMALTWQAAIQMEYGNWNLGEQLVNKALAIRQDIPELLELLNRIQNATAQIKSYDAMNLRSPKTWTQFGIEYDIIWTRYPSQAELQAANSLDQQAQQLWAAARQNLKAAVKKRAGTAEGWYFSGLLKLQEGDNSSVDDFAQAAKLEPGSRRYRETYIRALRRAGRDDDAAVEKERYTLEHETTATMRLASAWTDIDRTAFKSAGADLEQASAIDPSDSRLAAYQATLLTAANKHDDAAKWYAMALAQEEAVLELDGKTLRDDPKNTTPLTPDDAGFALLINLRQAARFEQMNDIPRRVAALEWNCAIGQRIDPAQRFFTGRADRAVLPNTFDVKAWAPKSAWNMVAWSGVMAGNAEAAAGKWEAALKHFVFIADASQQPDIYDPQALAVAGKARIYWGNKDPHHGRRAAWLQRAATLTRITDDEINAIGDIIGKASGKEGGERVATIQKTTMELSKFRAMPIIQGGYDYRQNPNYKGSFDPGPDDLPRGGIH